MPRLVVAYHRPGEPHGAAIVEDLALQAKSRVTSNVEIYTAPLEEAAQLCAPGDGIAALLPARGGHLDGLRDKAYKRNCRVWGPLPRRIVASYIVEASRTARGCLGMRLVYWKAKRLADAQEEDLAGAAREASRKLGKNIVLHPHIPGLPPAPPANGWCAIMASLLPGRLPGLYVREGWRVVGRYILEPAPVRRLVVDWLTTLIALVESGQPLGPS